MGEPLKGGVIGAGVFGGHHARKYVGAPDTVLSAVFDSHHPDRAGASPARAMTRSNPRERPGPVHRPRSAGTGGVTE